MDLIRSIISIQQFTKRIEVLVKEESNIGSVESHISKKSSTSYCMEKYRKHIQYCISRYLGHIRYRYSTQNLVTTFKLYEFYVSSFLAQSIFFSFSFLFPFFRLFFLTIVKLCSKQAKYRMSLTIIKLFRKRSYYSILFL